MKKLNFNFSLKKLNGEIAVKEASKFLAETIANENKGNALKIYSIAKRLWDNPEIELDKSDVILLKGIIENSETITILAKAQLLEVLEN